MYDVRCKTGDVLCRMVAAGGGVLAVTGATASLRGKPFTAGFAPAKAGQRMLAQSLARELGPQNVHVFYTIVDGLVRNRIAESFVRVVICQ